tara:strand:- start:829 stop:1413 length:585 start_codon:yes stop_codon:yes gene_type:complete
MSNTGIFTTTDINDLTSFNQWSGIAGQLELIQTQTVSAVTAVDFFDIKQNIYNQHFLTINNVTSTGTNESIAVRFYEQGLIRISNAYEYAFQNGTAGGTFDTSTATTSTRFFVTRFNDSGDEKNSYAYFYNLGDEEKYSFMTMQSVADHSGFEFRFGSAVMKRKSLVDGIRLFGTQSGSISGDFSLYGIRDLDV